MEPQLDGSYISVHGLIQSMHESSKHCLCMPVLYMYINCSHLIKVDDQSMFKGQ